MRADVAAMPHAKRKTPAPEPAKKKHGGGRPRNPPALGGVSAGSTARRHQSLTAALGLPPIRKTVVHNLEVSPVVSLAMLLAHGTSALQELLVYLKTPGVFENYSHIPYHFFAIPYQSKNKLKKTKYQYYTSKWTALV